jgi:hypothetical protein
VTSSARSQARVAGRRPVLPCAAGGGAVVIGPCIIRVPFGLQAAMPACSSPHREAVLPAGQSTNHGMKVAWALPIGAQRSGLVQ